MNNMHVENRPESHAASDENEKQSCKYNIVAFRGKTNNNLYDL